MFHHTAKVNLFGLDLPQVSERLSGLSPRQGGVSVTTVQADGIVSVLIQGRFKELSQARDEVAKAAEAVQEALGPFVFGHEEQTLAESVIELLAGRRLTLATAESCTGGWVGKMITDVAGSSEVYRGGWICYHNSMKRDQLGIPEALLDQHGAVSGPVASAMAQEAARRSGADLAVAVTGIAGPEGGTVEKPVGTVWISTALRGSGVGSDAPLTGDAFCLSLRGVRAEVRDRAAKYALQAVRFEVLGQPLSLLASSVALAPARNAAGDATISNR